MEKHSERDGAGDRQPGSGRAGRVRRPSSAGPGRPGVGLTLTLVLALLPVGLPAGAATPGAPGWATAASAQQPAHGGDGAAAGASSEAEATVTLEEALETALRNNPLLVEARADVDAARSRRLEARGAFLPDVSVGYDYSRASTGRIDATGQSFATSSNSMELGGRLDLFQGLRRFRNLESSNRRVDAEEASAREARYRAVLDVKSAYFDAVARRELVEVRESRVERQRNQLAFVRQRVAQGKATASDSLRSRVELNDARVALIQARNDARASTFALAEAMGTEGPVRPDPSSSLQAAELPYDRTTLLRIALENAPSVVAAEASTSAAASEVDAARASYLPELELSGGYAWASQDFPPSRRSWSWSLSASYPLFDGFDRESQVARARSDLQAARARRRKAELELRSDLDAAYNRIQAARASIELAEESVELSREDLRVSRERYRMGLATIVDLQAAQTELADAEASLVQRRFDLQLGLARLEALLGRELRDPELMARADRLAADASAGAPEPSEGGTDR